MTLTSLDNSQTGTGTGDSQYFNMSTRTGRIVLDKFDWSGKYYDEQPYFSWQLIGGEGVVASGICDEPYTPNTASSSPTTTAAGSNNRPRCTPNYQADFNVRPAQYEVRFASNNGDLFKFEVQEFR